MGVAPFAVRAAESIRPSATGAEASEGRKVISLPQNYNIKVGPVLMDMSAGFGVEFNDNVGISETDRQSDIVLRPQINWGNFWQVTKKNTLRLNLGLSYAKHLNDSSLDSSALLVDPGTALAFDVYVGPFRITVFDEFAVLQNPVDEIGLSNVAVFDRIQNAVGIQVLGDFNDVQVVVGYKHFNFWSLNDDYSFLDRSEEQFYGSVSFRLSAEHMVGVDASTGAFSYDEDFNNNGLSISAGAFWEMVLSNYLQLRLAAGWQGMPFDSGGGNGDSTDYGGWYANATVSNRLNAYWTHSLAAGHEGRLGLTVNFYEFDYVRYSAAWRMNSRMVLGMDAFFESANESGSGLTSENSTRWGVGIGTSYQLNPRMSATLRYDFARKDSDVEFRSYYQNRVLIGITYDF
jgi:opacity protein-like surface antigen